MYRNEPDVNLLLFADILTQKVLFDCVVLDCFFCFLLFQVITHKLEI